MKLVTLSLYSTTGILPAMQAPSHSLMVLFVTTCFKVYNPVNLA
jgi:hypothetical protein